MGKYTRKRSEDRERELLLAASRLARRVGYRVMSRGQVAREAGVSPSLLNRYFGTVDGMRRAVVRHAIQTEDKIILRQALAAKDRTAMRAPAELRRAIITSML